MREAPPCRRRRAVVSREVLPAATRDEDTQHLIAAILRPGTVHASRFVVLILRRLIRLLRTRWPGVPIEVRADSGFALSRLSRFCDRENIVYTIGLATNSRLTTLAQDLLADAIAQQKAADVPKIRLAGEASYAAASWDKARRIVYKAEALPQGPNTRFVVTTRTDPPLALYDFYVQRGTPEQWIDQLNAPCFADRLSCCDFWPNQCRLLLSAATYWLLHTLRSWLERAQIVPMRLETVRLAVLKIGARVFEFPSLVRLRLASSHPRQALWPLLAAHRAPS